MIRDKYKFFSFILNIMGNEIDDILEAVGAVAIGAAIGLGLAALLEALRKAQEEEKRRR